LPARQQQLAATSKALQMIVNFEPEREKKSIFRTKASFSAESLIVGH
jgi:hypothetical protein